MSKPVSYTHLDVYKRQDLYCSDYLRALPLTRGSLYLLVSIEGKKDCLAAAVVQPVSGVFDVPYPLYPEPVVRNIKPPDMQHRPRANHRRGAMCIRDRN